MKPSPQERLSQWLSEYHLDQVLHDAGPIPACRAVIPSEPSFGDLRLLVAGPRPCYGIVLPGNESDFRWLPFSPYTLPAFDRELLWRDEGPLRVLQVWNLRAVPADALRQSWLVEPLDFGQVRNLLDAIEGRENAWPVGPPLQHPLDPRHDYLDESQEWVDACLGEFDSAAAPDHLLAAEQGSEYGEPEDED